MYYNYYYNNRILTNQTKTLFSPGLTCAVCVLSITWLMLLVVLIGGVGQAHCWLLGWGRRHKDSGGILESWGNSRHTSIIWQTCEMMEDVQMVNSVKPFKWLTSMWLNMIFFSPPYQCIHSQEAEGGWGRPGSVSADPGSDPAPVLVCLPAVSAGAVTAPQL